MSLQIVVLAAGKGQRMHSALPKVLHLLAGKPLLAHVLETALAVSTDRHPIVIYGHLGDQVKAVLSHFSVQWVEQTEQYGTGHALLQALPYINDADQVLVLSGDVPLMRAETVKALIEETPAGAVGMLTAVLDNPKGYGRVVRHASGVVQRVVEEKDANEAERLIQEINAGVYLAPAAFLKTCLPLLNKDNAQGEYYLPDMIVAAIKEKMTIVTVQPACVSEIKGVNDRVQLSACERLYQRQLAVSLMKQGVSIADPDRIDIRGEVEIASDVYIDVNVVLEGNVRIGTGCHIGAHSVIRESVLAQDVAVRSHSVIEGAEIGAACVIGPFARIRPGTVLAAEVHIGNFVEIKQSQIGLGSKVNHLSYIGDSDVGCAVNIGAGTITCNYDGAHKHKTVIGDKVHIGSGTQLVAPIMVGEGATIGAGSTLVVDAPAYALTLTHQLSQRSIEGWVRPRKK
ncbi:MAG TPA: bifunctional UDP-N-acetylglucosamine diphosphorylase/glucosamine-1-phosphate N-acetyltransferase GlmU [Gammaproteobacteria bacterium]|jgi:bifunctional UDP-N-acetylglucosamine pyrophosphorylase/glucosamine-1-phosphate N-acetyltransferase|nr:bifunctional UDP-N-acetylglucosamine diphosphorylase/glucosamine-1-phosphate N-acetyltransferase GlmU [Gammaproteobacteria bacterium]